MSWTVYVLVACDEQSTYVGITTELDRRLQQHNGERPGGAKSTTRGRPWSLGATYGPFEERAEAQSVEYQVKRLRGQARLNWDASQTLG